ncbi:D-glycero-beta-D-manno-heptose 1,7-bisphosphate 7-phosphatase [Beggiatoa leptomitoformis]|uniref:D,D-heptose 1,7-bisphosphate phosphatase n=1 Tax=Beggiatoa leptomitoformis TaxID=288004 RepID=A0A2N9YIH5_9GAMM|nr:D-glycero-beta-D-manno-heptose 1,7-bisphosphate 7-phosphatase [Beggiatoa leptomitoformis]ALG67734.1 D-glycero-beta-D-manno-heptose 1,7-bisphosphate 7-phosphatase [Beggiatoa leptomitoformis]AUI70026.1 D-glycero-beta-D-manno-heptose 1,7-bisphosphate 7-phosphatase [Beggiatoa leptomitoformis]
MKLVILDRDGVINHDSNEYIKSPDEWHAIPGSLAAIARLNQAGYRVVVITNQSGVARGLFTLDDLNAIHNKMYQQLSEVGGNIEAIFFCPHNLQDDCQCRKPRAGLFHNLAERLGISLTGVPAVGDSLRDLQAAITCGAKPLLVLTGKGEKTLQELNGFGDVAVYENLASVVDDLLSEKHA